MDQFKVILTETTTPVVLISSVGLLILSLVNRQGQAAARIRALLRDTYIPPDVRDREVDILMARLRILRSSMLAIVLSACSSSGLILTSLIELLFHLSLQNLKIGLLSLSVIALLVSIILMFIDVTRSLAAIKVDVASIREKEKKLTRID